MEEINERFGEQVIVHLTQLTDEERAELDTIIQVTGRNGEKPAPVHVENFAEKGTSTVDMRGE